jgi:hypothetical protein
MRLAYLVEALGGRNRFDGVERSTRGKHIRNFTTSLTRTEGYLDLMSEIEEEREVRGSDARPHRLRFVGWQTLPATIVLTEASQCRFFPVIVWLVTR